MSTQNTSEKPRPTEENACEEIGEIPGEGNTADHAGATGFVVSKRVTRADLNTATDFNQRNQTRSSFSKIRRALKQRSNSQGKAHLLGYGTQNRGRFLSLDSSDIFRTRAAKSNRRSSWYGGNIRNTSVRKYSKTPQSNYPTRRCSKASVQTLDSDGLPVRCGTRFDVRVDVHRTVSGTPVDPGVDNGRCMRPSVCKPNAIICVEPSSDRCLPKFHPTVPEIVVDKTELYELNGRFCKWWLRSIDKLTRPCPCCSQYLGPVLITISMCTGLVIAFSMLLLFVWIFAKIGAWWA